MPALSLPPHDRRAFLRQTFLGATALLLPFPAAGADENDGAFPIDETATLRVSLLSDTHIPGDRKNGYRGFLPNDNLRQIVPEILHTRPQSVILNGDAARLEGLPEDYLELQTLIAPLRAQTPVIIGLGNHDDRGNFQKAFPDSPGTHPSVPGKHVTLLDHPVVRILVLDSLLYVNRASGLLGRDQRNWLATALPQMNDRPVVLFVHHTLGDGDGDLLDVDRLFALLQPHSQVKAIFYGHSHVWELSERQGIKLINLPAVGYNFRDTDPVGWVDAQFQRSGVDLILHATAGNRTEDGRKVRIDWA